MCNCFLLEVEIASVLQDASTRFSKLASSTRWPAEPTRRTHQFCCFNVLDARTASETRGGRAYILLASKMMKLWALAIASAGSVSALLPVIVPMSDNTNDTLLTWGPVTADISANRCRAFAVA